MSNIFISLQKELHGLRAFLFAAYVIAKRYSAPVVTLQR